MINTILVFDENDKDLGSFFELCRENLDEFFTEKEIPKEIIDRNSVFEIIIPLTIDKFKNGKFVFAAFTHGDKNNLLKSGTYPYISTTDSLSIFKKSFFYTFACEAGEVLGKELVNQGCKCFIGYNKKTYIWNTFQIPFVNTATYGLKLFFDGENTKTIFSKMKDLYNEEIDKIYENDFVIASILMDNRDALVLHGENINISSMIKNEE
jgi:hypothetical protein